MRVRFPRFRQRKKKEVVEVKKPELERKPEKEFPRISTGEQKKYIGKHVAIMDGKIVTAARSAGQVLAQVEKKHPKKKIILRYVVNDKLLLKCKCLKR